MTQDQSDRAVGPMAGITRRPCERLEKLASPPTTMAAPVALQIGQSTIYNEFWQTYLGLGRAFVVHYAIFGIARAALSYVACLTFATSPATAEAVPEDTHLDDKYKSAVC